MWTYVHPSVLPHDWRQSSPLVVTDEVLGDLNSEPVTHNVIAVEKKSNCDMNSHFPLNFKSPGDEKSHL
jgi:hypothetical protein